ncbi:MAG: hypothetical protein IPM29_11335 [Planctomycetes bacterium]|nr:hypothetical protein [Planctomycetota bacterium]
MNPKMLKHNLAWLPAAGLLALLVGCDGGSPTGVRGTSGDFLVLRTTPPNNGRLYLNEPIRLDMSNRVDLSTADLNTVSFQVFDLNGTPLTERPAGTFSLARSAGDTEVGRQLVFSPRFPTNNTYDNGGFKPGRIYVVQLVEGNARSGTVLRDVNGRGLATPVTFEFRTADGTTPTQLFSDTRAGGPRLTSFEVTPLNTNGTVPLNRFSQEPVEFRLTFDQPLNPSDDNVPVSVSADPLQRDISDRGRMFLEYDDPTGRNTWIPSTVDLESNTREGSVVVLRPIGVLPNNAEIRLVIENTVEDMSGESNVSDASYNRVARTVLTSPSFAPQYDAVIEHFAADSAVDLAAAFLEPVAAISDGRVQATFAFEGGESRLTYRPQDRQVTLNTDFTQITPVNNPPINVAGGVFNFAEVEIPQGVEVAGAGTNPMVWLVTGDFTVNGKLRVDGGDGARVDTLNSANFPTGGGIGVCGGGNGGLGSPNPNDRSPSGQPGFGPGQKPNGGGEAGRLSCSTSCNRGSAGGGGSLGAAGDPYYPPNPAAQRWRQVGGEGGFGCLNKSLPGGQPGPRPFTDSRTDNDFWGAGVNVFRQIRIEGELITPVAGGGGGGGGDRSTSCSIPDPSGFINDNKGGGGGGGAGVLIIKALGTIRIGPEGEISATGGNGGGGEQAGGNNEGGGGGAGAGGMVILMAGQGFEIHVHSSRSNATQATYGNNENDYFFAIAADGGIGTQGRFTSEIANKYPPGTTAWDTNPTGGFGGMGIVQLMAPPGDDADGTGNRLDDNIVFYEQFGGARNIVTPARKKQLLAWRGWPNETGQYTDDTGAVLNIGNNEGDIRPSPIMLPSPFGALSRARSRWIDLGFAVRERIDAGTTSTDPRVVAANPGEEPRPDFGDPDLGYGGTSMRIDDPGYATYDPQTGEEVFPVLSFGGSNAFTYESIDTNASYEGGPAYALVVPTGSPVAGLLENRYANYRVEVRNDSGTRLADFRILGHRERTIWLEPSETFPQNVADFRILVKFFGVAVDGLEGLGPSYIINSQGEQAPIANVRIGFAFSVNPYSGPGPDRWPSGTNPNESLYEFDLLNPDFLNWLQANRPRFVQWDILFNTRFHPTQPGNSSGEPLRADMPLPAVDYLVLPYRF